MSARLAAVAARTAAVALALVLRLVVANQSRPGDEPGVEAVLMRSTETAMMAADAVSRRCDKRRRLQVGLDKEHKNCDTK